MGRFITPPIWESHFEPPTKAVIWKKATANSGAPDTVEFAKYGAGWVTVTLDQVTEPAYLRQIYPVVGIPAISTYPPYSGMPFRP
jgi:hypothetical protein